MTAVARTIRIGVTGPIGCGKSQVGHWLAERGARVVDADRVAREVTAPGTPVHAAILRRFGASVTAADGTVDRAALGRVVFADPAALRDLEALVHPAVRPRILELIAAGLSNREIGERVHVSENTVKTHSSRVFAKLGAQRRTQAHDDAGLRLRNEVVRIQNRAALEHFGDAAHRDVLARRIDGNLHAGRHE